MKALDNAIKEIKTLQPDELMKVYDMIVTLKKRREKIESRSRQINDRSMVLEALKDCQTDFSSDIISHREDRW
jgi:hypothetical protein